ncbi:MAG: hypothetical protein IH868_09475 [Chloroflexi bacterium]|nr:hypothetical protein [Chloroflexota bacterium]
MIRVKRGAREWVALVEVKTGRNKLERDQIENYLDVCRQEGFDAVLTISNEFLPAPGEHPVQVNRRKVQRVGLYHLSWIGVLTEAVIQHEHRGVEDPDQAWILNELIAYLEDDRSGAMAFGDMGPSWTSVRDAVRHGTVRASDGGVADVVGRWDELARSLCLRLGRNLGADIQQILPKRERSDANVRRAAASRALADESKLRATFRVPDTVGDIVIEADLKAKSITVSTSLGAPGVGRPKTRINWLVRQLSKAPDSLRVDVSFEKTARSTSNLLGELREEPSSALDGIPGRNPRAFKVNYSVDMGAKQGSGPGSFVGSVRDGIETFYKDVAQNLKAWTPPAPKLLSTSSNPEPPVVALTPEAQNET